MSQIFQVIHSLTPCHKFCFWALMIAINMSVATGQLGTCEFSVFEKKSPVQTCKYTPE